MSAAAARALCWTWLGRASYQPVAALQEDVRRRVLAGEPDAERLLLVEHEPVITLGRSADPAHVLAPRAQLARRGVGVVASSRGGDVTYHGPGQLVVYPIVRLPAGVAAFVEAVGRAIADQAAALGVRAEFRRRPAGVWVGEAKLAACGVHVTRGVAIHGFALNVTDEPLAGFPLIVPCGITGVRVTSLAAAGAAAVPPLAELAASLARRVCSALARTPVCACHVRPTR